MLTAVAQLAGATVVSGGALTLVGAALLRFAAVASPTLRLPQGSTWLFSSLLTGITATVLTTSLIATAGESISLVLLGAASIGVASVLADGAHTQEPSHGAASARWWFAGTGVAVCLWFTVQNMHAGSFPWQVPFRDTAHYAQIATAMIQTGVETPVGPESILAPELFRAAPYHYFGIWLAAALATAWRLPTLLAVMVMAPAILALALGAGLLALADKPRPTRTARLWAVVALWLAPFLPRIALQTHLLREADVFTGFGSILGHPKLLPIYLCIVAALLLAESGHVAAALIAVACSGVVNFTVMPVTVVVAAAGLIKAFGHSTLSARVAFATPAFMVIAVLLFYWWHGGETGLFPSIHEVLRAAMDQTTLRTRVNIVGKTTIQLLCAYSPLFVFAGRRALGLEFRRHGFILAAVLGAGLGSWVLLDRWANAVQFFSNAAVVFLNVLVVVVYSRASAARRRAAIAAIALLTAWRLPEVAARVTGPPRYDDAFLRSLDRLPGRVGGFTVSSAYLRHAFPHERNLRVNAPEYLGFQGRAAVPLICPTQELARIEPATRSLIESTLACQYLVQRSTGGDSSVDVGRMLSAFGLGFVVTRGVDAPLPRSGCAPTLISEDRLSGEAIYAVRPSCGQD